MRRGVPFWFKLSGAFLVIMAVAVGAMAIIVSLFMASSLSQGSAQEAELLGILSRALFLAALVAGAGTLLLAIPLARQLAAPWRSLTVAARQLAAGRHTLRVRPGGLDEAGLLAGALNSLAETLEQQEAQRRQLVADIADELRTPLAVIRGNLEALLDGIYRPTAETITPIHEETLLLTRLVDELRDLALAEAGQLPLYRAKVDPTELARGVLSGFQAHANERNIELLLVLPSVGLPPVDVDAARIRQVLSNLLANALRHTPQRGRIQVALQVAPGGWIEVRVGDSGPGISQQDLPHVFDRFYRSSGASRTTKGAGLGLYLSKAIIEAHGGRIWVDPKPGEGARICFSLPREGKRGT